MKTKILHGIPVKDDRYSLLQNIVDQLESCHYEHEGISLEENVAFIELKEMAKSQMEDPKFVLVFEKYPKIGFLKSGLFDSVKYVWNKFPLWTRTVIIYHVHRISKHVNYLDRFEKKALEKIKAKENLKA